jgi:HEAT repeat protein
MADKTLSKLVSLIAGADSPEMRCAAILVSGRVGTAKDKGLVKSLLKILLENDVETRVAALAALGQLRAEEALPSVLELVRQGGPELEAAVQTAGHLGARGIKSLSKIMAETTPSLRSRMAAVLAKSGTGGALVATAHALLDIDPKVVDAAARSLAAEVPTFHASQKHALSKFLIDSLKSKEEVSSKAEAAMLRLLGSLHDPSAEDMFWSRLATGIAPEVRASALHGLGQNDTPTSSPRLQSLVACATDPDFQIVAPALMILKKIPVSAKNSKYWLKLLNAPDVAARRFAVEKLSGLETEEVARGLLQQMKHADRILRDEALQALLGFAKGRQALLDNLLDAPTQEECWDLCSAMDPVAKRFPAGMRSVLFEKAGAYQSHDDRRAAPLWHFLREMDAGWTRDQLEARASALRKKKKYAEAVAFYRLLAHDPACGENIRFELAATGLKISNHDTAVDARQADPALAQFGRLLQNPSFDLLRHVNQAKWLDGNDLFYLGFHFVEQNHRAREFGKAVLELVAKRLPKAEVGKNAQKKLKSAGAL